MKTPLPVLSALAQEEGQAERVANTARMILLAILTVVAAVNALKVKSEASQINFVALATGYAYGLIVFLLLRRNRYYPSMKYVTSIADVVIVYLVLGLYMVVDHPAVALKNYVFILLFPLIALTVFRFDPKLTWVTGSVAIILYLLLFASASSEVEITTRSYKTELLSESVTLIGQVTKWMMLVIFVVLTGYLSRYTRDLFARHAGRLHYANQQLSALNKVSEEIGELPDEETLLGLVPQKLCEALDFDRSILWLMERGTPYIRSHYWTEDQHLFTKLVEEYSRLLKKIQAGEAPVPPAIAEFIENGKTEFFEDIPSAFYWTEALSRDARTKSIVMIPIHVHDTMIGFLSANLQYHEREMDKQDIDKVETFANLVSVTIENLRHLHSLEALVEKRTRALREAQTQLVQSEKMAALGNLVAGIAHEVNNPIAAVNSASDSSVRCIEKIKTILHEKNADAVLSDPKFKSALQILEDNNRLNATASERIVKIVASLKNFARLDEADFQKVDVHEGLESTLTLVHHELKNRIRVVRNFGNLPKVECFPNQLNQVFMNLIVNAAQAIRGEGSITITTSSEGGHITIRIADTGTGIPPENMQKIFDPGFTTKQQGIGSGLGLSISYNIVQKHQGKIKVRSEPGDGSEFTIVLPASHPDRVQKKG